MAEQSSHQPSTSESVASSDMTPTVSQIHLRHCILYEYQLAHTAAEATRNLCQALGAEAVSETTTRKWFTRFREGHFDLTDLPRSGRPTECDENLLLSLIESNPRQTTRDLAATLVWSQDTVQRHLHTLGKVCKLGSWVPHANPAQFG